MTYAPSELVRRAWEKPPRCLDGFNATPVEDPPDGTFNELGYFSLACACGGKSFRVLGYPQEDGFVAAPLSLTCVLCSRTTELFDIEAHGYDAELDHGCSSTRGTGTPSELRCPACQELEFSAQAGFSYQIEPEELEPEESERIQDLFDWFYLKMGCSSCDEVTTASDYECA